MLKNQNFKGHAQLKPRIMDTQSNLSVEEEDGLIKKMWQYLEGMSDFDCDVLDFHIHEWICQRKGPKEYVIVRIDNVLAKRGITKRKAPTGKRSGYRSAQRVQVLASIDRLTSVSLELVELELYGKMKSGRQASGQSIHSRVCHVEEPRGQYNFEGHLEVDRVVFRPVEIFSLFLLGRGRQIALLSAKALAYNPHAQNMRSASPDT